MSSTKYGEIECFAIRHADGRFQGAIRIAAPPLDSRPTMEHVCTEYDDTESQAIRRAMDFVNSNYPI